MVRTIRPLLLGITLAAFGASLASAQRVDVNVGFGSAWAGSNHSGIDNLNAANSLGSCSLSAGDPYCQSTSSLSGFFLGFGADAMLTRHFGIGGEVNLQPTRYNYGPLQSRQTFYDFNGIYEPLSTKRASLQFQVGIGGAATSFSISQSGCVGTAVCSSATQSVGSSKHFQVHAGLGLQVNLTEHVFLRPQIDYRYVPGFTDQFGSNSVPSATLWLGYTFGR